MNIIRSVIVSLSVLFVMDCGVIGVTEMPMFGEGDGTMFDPEVITACEQWTSAIAYSEKDVRWTGRNSWKVVNDMTDEVVFVGSEDQCLVVMADLNTWWDHAPVEARVLFVYGYTEAAEKADSVFQEQVKAMQDDFESFMATVNNKRGGEK